jgi:signal transduction histidine kinase
MGAFGPNGGDLEAALATTQEAILRLEGELAALDAEEAPRRRELAILLDLLARLAADPRIEAVGGHLLRCAVAQLHARSAWLWVCDPASGRMIPARAGDAACGTSPGEPDAGGPPEGCETLARQVIARGEALPVGDLARDTGLDAACRARLLEGGIASLLLVPLFRAADAIGAYAVADRVPRSWSADEIQLARMLGQYLTLAVHLDRLAASQQARAALEERTRAIQRYVTRLEQANSEIRRTLDLLATEPAPDLLLGRLLAALAAHVRSDTASLWLASRGEWPPALAMVCRNGRVVDAALGEQPLAGYPFPWTRDEWRTPTLREVAVRHLTPAVDAMAAGAPETVIVVPLVLATDLLGYVGIWLRGRPAIEPDRLATLAALGQQVSVALHLTDLAREAEDAAVHAERHRLAREIHDSLAQTLTATIMHLSVAADSAHDQPEQAEAHARMARDLALAGSAEARRSTWVDAGSHGCHDLVAALARTAQSMSTRATTVSFAVAGTPAAIDGTTAVELLRIAQEGLTNAARHASATDVRLTLAFAEEALELCIADNGVGLEEGGRPRETGLGLQNMRERARQLGAAFAIESRPGQGVTITTRMAWPPRAGGGRPDCAPRSRSAPPA